MEHLSQKELQSITGGGAITDSYKDTVDPKLDKLIPYPKPVKPKPQLIEM